MPKTGSRVRSTGATRLAAVVLLTTVPAACSHNGVGPGDRGKPGIEATAGAGISDTVDAVPLQALVVTVRGPDARPVAGAVVRFEPLLASRPDAQAVPSLLISSLAGVNWSYLVADSTDTGGEASVRVRFGGIAGPSGVVISVPELGYQDTVRYTIEPGQPARLSLAPRDTAVFVEGAYSLRGGLTDRYGNVRPEPVTLTTTASEVSVDAAGRVEGEAIGRARIVGSYEDMTDTVEVSVVPRGSLVGSRDGRLFFVNLDGSGEREVDSSVGAGMYRMQWLPGGEEFAMLLFRNGTHRNNGYRVDQSGRATALIPDAVLDTIGDVSGFRVTPDGGSAFFSAACGSGSRSYRMDLSTLSVTRVSPAAPPGSSACESEPDQDPSPSPNGSRVVVFSPAYLGVFSGPMAVIDVATRKRTPLGVQGGYPVWSPSGDLIAYWLDDQIFVVNPDGTGVRALTPAGNYYYPVVSWSPDGKWLFAILYTLGRMQMIRVEDGLTLTLPIRMEHEPSMRSEVF